jgi:hypothetical protein
MRFLAFAVISFISALLGAFLSPSTWLHKSLAIALCGVLSANPALCTNNAIAQSQEASATNPVKVETTQFNNLLAQRSRDFDDDTPKSLPLPNPNNNPKPPSFPNEVSPNFPVRRPDFDGLDVNMSKYIVVNTSNLSKFEVRGVQNESIVAEISSTSEIQIHYTENQGIEMLFYIEPVSSTNNKSLFKNQSLGFINVHQNDNQFALIDPDVGSDSPRCLACSAIEDMISKFNKAKDFDSAINTKIPAGYKITKLLLKGDLIGATWQSYEQVKKSVKSAISLKPLKSILRFLYDKAMNCNSEITSICSKIATPPSTPTPIKTPELPRGSGKCGPDTYELPKDEAIVRQLCSNAKIPEGFMTCLWGQPHFNQCSPYRQSQKPQSVSSANGNHVPVITSFTCDGAVTCELRPYGAKEFSKLEFTYSDNGGDASHFEIAIPEAELQRIGKGFVGPLIRGEPSAFLGNTRSQGTVKQYIDCENFRKIDNNPPLVTLTLTLTDYNASRSNPASVTVSTRSCYYH